MGATTKRDSLVWCSDDGPVRCCYSLYDSSPSYSLRENQSDRNRTVKGSMITLRDLLILNLTLQVFDGLFSYQVFSLGAAEANPFVSAAISSWGVIYGLVYKKILACALLLLIFVLRHRLPSLTKQGLIVTASAYGLVEAVSLWKLLSWE